MKDPGDPKSPDPTGSGSGSGSATLILGDRLAEVTGPQFAQPQFFIKIC